MSKINCNGCTSCCRHDMIRLLPEKGDDVQSYRIEIRGRSAFLAHKEDGSCVYLGDYGCTIHDRKPIECRQYDCRKAVSRYGPDGSVRQQSAIEQGIIRMDILKAARERSPGGRIR